MSQNTNQDTIPPKSPDINPQLVLTETESSSFKEKLLANEHEKNISIISPLPHQIPMEINVTTDNEVAQLETTYRNNYYVPITIEDKQRIYYPWRFSLIIKLQGKRILRD